MSYEYMTGMGATTLLERMRQIGERRDAEACGGVACSSGWTREVVEQDPDDFLSFANREREMRDRDCTMQCVEGGAFYYCCPPQIRMLSVLPGVMQSLNVTAAPEASVEDQEIPPPPVEEVSSFPWAAVSVVGILGLGAAGFAGYWFWWRKREEA